MFNAKRLTFFSAAALAAASWTGPLVAAEATASSSFPAGGVVSSTPTLSSAVAPPMSEYVLARRNPFGSRPISTDLLASKRGGDRVFNDNQLKGVVSDNHASNLSTGMNVISDGAFAGSVGMPTVIQNSGNNVLIQNATIVNVQLK